MKTITISRVRTIVARWPWAEVGAAAALLAGWALITWAIAELAPARIVWRVSAGLFLLSLFGFRLFLIIARDGLYALTRSKP